MSEAFVKELREGARIHHDLDTRIRLKYWADEVDTSTRIFTESPTNDNLKDLVGVWTRAKIYFDSLTFNGSPDGRGAAIRIDERKAA